MTKKEEILEEAYRQFAVKGLADTHIDDIAKGLRISKKTIYMLFRSKEDLFVEMVVLKVNRMEERVKQVQEMDAPIVSKLINYIDAILEHAAHLSLKSVGDSFLKRERISSRIQSYMKEAVFTRLKNLLNQAKLENRLKEGVDLDSALMIYWESIGTFLFTRPVKTHPPQFIEKPISELLGQQLVNTYRGFLNEDGIKEFDAQLIVHERLAHLIK